MSYKNKCLTNIIQYDSIFIYGSKRFPFSALSLSSSYHQQFAVQLANVSHWVVPVDNKLLHSDLTHLKRVFLGFSTLSFSDSFFPSNVPA